MDEFWERLRKIPFTECEYEYVVEDYIEEHLRGLVFEWLKRTLDWYNLLSLPITQGNGLHFYLAQEAVSILAVPEDLSLAEPIQSWFCEIRKALPGRFTLALIEGALFWKLWEIRKVLPHSTLKDPYEPIIEFFEWGGWIFHEHGTITNFRPMRGQFSGSPARAGNLIHCREESY